MEREVMGRRQKAETRVTIRDLDGNFLRYEDVKPKRQTDHVPRRRPRDAQTDLAWFKQREMDRETFERVDREPDPDPLDSDQPAGVCETA